MSPAAQARRVRALASELERYAPLFNSTTDFVFAKDLSGKYVAANPAYLTALRRSAVDVVGHDDAALFSEGDAREHLARECLVQLCGQTVENEATLPLDGQHVELIVRRAPWRDASGALVGTISVATDITRARAPHGNSNRQGVELRGSNARLQQMLADQTRFSRRMALLLEAGRELISTLESERIQRIAVDAVEQSIETVACAFAGYSRATNQWTILTAGARCQGLFQVADSFDAADAPFTDEVLRGQLFKRPRVRSTRRVFDATVQAAGLSGYVVLPVTYARALQAALMVAWSGDAQPATEEQWFLETLSVQAALALHNAALYEQLDASLGALRRVQDQSGHANQLQALGQVASGVAHDFNNSLTTILGLSDWLLHELPADTPFYGDLETIRTAAQDAAGMVRRLQMFGRLRPDSARESLTESVDLGAVITAVVELVRPRCQELSVKTGRVFDITVETNGGLFVKGVAAEIRELLVNLVFNGFDAMPDGGNVRLMAGWDQGRPVVAVTDAGVGMIDEVKSRIFEPFFSTKGHKGNGLGLSMCVGLAERHGAELTVESSPGQGSTFTLTFPAEVPITPEVPAPDLADVPAPRSLAVLVVDDQRDVCDSLGAMVSALGHSVTKARDGASALDLALARPFDVLVTDLGMPGMNGLELARSVAGCRPNTAVVLVTAWGDEFGDDAARVGALVVSKPVTMAAIRHALTDAMARHVPARNGLRLVHSSETRS
jgi:PAS domain S-box-containing protein